MENVRYNLALGLLNGVGAVTAKNLLAYCGSAEEVFKMPLAKLLKIPDIGKFFVKNLNKEEALKLADEELELTQKNNISIVFYGEDNYPGGLLHCNDAPYYLFYKGAIDFNTSKSISIVGTRYATNYGKDVCAKLIKDIVEMGFKPLVVSGLAYGIDVCAHKAALDNGLKTVAVLGTGVNKIYPSAHTAIAREIESSGGLISEFHSNSKIVPGNFVSRNRIIAGITEATIVVESPIKGGSLITADIASSYNRDVLTFPGRTNDTQSAGCNNLIKRNIAALITDAHDLVKALNWDVEKTYAPRQLDLFKKSLPAEELKIINLLDSQDGKSVDELSRETQIGITELSATLLNMEFANLIKVVPGNRYRRLI